MQHDAQLVGFEWETSGYFPMVYPPFHYQLASFASGMSYQRFYVAWMFASGIALSTLLLAILTVSFVLLHRERPFKAGLVFGLIAFKPYLAIPIGLVMLCKKQYHFVAGSFATLFIITISSLLIAPEAWSNYIQVCLGMGDYVSNGGYQLENSHSLWGSMQLLLGNLNPTLVKPFALIAAIGVLTLITRIMSGPIELSSPRFAFQFAALIVATVLISPHFYTYDLTILLLPLAICGLSEQVQAKINRRVMYWTCIAVLFGASVYGPIATSLGFQVSTVVLLVWLIIIAGGWNTSKDRALAKFVNE